MSSTDWLQCCNCHEVFRDFEADTSESSDSEEFWGARVLRTTIDLRCPSCGSDDYRDFTPCVSCEEDKTDHYDWNEPIYGIDHCIACSVEVLDESEFLDVHYYAAHDSDVVIMNRLVRKSADG